VTFCNHPTLSFPFAIPEHLFPTPWTLSLQSRASRNPFRFFQLSFPFPLNLSSPDLALSYPTFTLAFSRYFPLTREPHPQISFGSQFILDPTGCIPAVFPLFQPSTPFFTYDPLHSTPPSQQRELLLIFFDLPLYVFVPL